MADDRIRREGVDDYGADPERQPEVNESVGRGDEDIRGDVNEDDDAAFEDTEEAAEEESDE